MQRFLAPLVITLMLFTSLSNALGVSAQESTPTIPVVCEGGLEVIDPAQCGATTPTDTTQVVTQETPVAASGTVYVCAEGSLAGQTVTDPMACVQPPSTTYVCADGTTQPSADLCNTQSQPTPAPTNQVPQAAPANANDIIVNNNTDVAVDVDVNTQPPAGRVSFNGDCPDIMAVQHELGDVLVAKDGAKCAFYMRWMSHAESFVAPVGWGVQLQVENTKAIGYIGDGRLYEGIAFTVYPGVSSPCAVWAGLYQKKLEDDAAGVGYDAYVALPSNIASCTAKINGQEYDALSMGLVTDLSELNNLVVDAPTAVEVPAQVTQETTDTASAVTVTPETAVVSEQETAPVVTEVTVSPASTPETESVQPTDPAAIAAMFANDPDLGNFQNWTFIPQDGGFQYTGPSKTLVVPDGFVVNDSTDTHRYAGQEIAPGNFTLYFS